MPYLSAVRHVFTLSSSLALMNHLFPAPLRHRPVRPRSQRGFSLIEVLVSVLLLSFGVLGLIGLQTRAIGMTNEAEERNTAARLADDVASEMWMAHTVSLPAARVTAWEDFVEDAAKSRLPNGTLQIAAISGRTDAVDLTITWRAPTRATTDVSTLSTRVVISQDPT